MSKPYTAGNKLLATDLNTDIKFGGDGSDGAKTVSTSENINAAGANYVVKNYTSLTINASQILGLINPHSTLGTLLHIKISGNLIINGTLDLSGLGGAAGAAVSADNSGGSSGSMGVGALNTGTNLIVAAGTAIGDLVRYNPATNGIGGGPGSKATSFAKYAGGGGGGGGLIAGSFGSNGTSPTSSNAYGGSGGSFISGAGGGFDTFFGNKFLLIGAGGGGASGGCASALNTSGAGGAGGGGLIIEVIGNITLGASSIINLSGNNGGNASGSDSFGAGGGGGGGGGIGKILYQGTLTDSGLTKTVSGGAAGTGIGGSGAGGAGGAGSIDIIKNIEIS